MKHFIYYIVGLLAITSNVYAAKEECHQKTFVFGEEKKQMQSILTDLRNIKNRLENPKLTREDRIDLLERMVDIGKGKLMVYANNYYKKDENLKKALREFNTNFSLAILYVEQRIATPGAISEIDKLIAYKNELNKPVFCEYYLQSANQLEILKNIARVQLASKDYEKSPYEILSKLPDNIHISIESNATLKKYLDELEKAENRFGGNSKVVADVLKKLINVLLMINKISPQITTEAQFNQAKKIISDIERTNVFKNLSTKLQKEIIRRDKGITSYPQSDSLKKYFESESFEKYLQLKDRILKLITAAEKYFYSVKKHVPEAWGSIK